MQPKGRRVEQAVEEPDATVLIVADCPVAQTGQSGSARSEDASRANHACGAESTARLGAGLIDPREARRLMGDVELSPVELPAEVG